MKCCLSSCVVLSLALAGCGKSDKPGPAATNNTPAPVPAAGAPATSAANAAVAAAPGGQDTPENALRAYVRVLRDGDLGGYKTLLGQNPKGVADYVTMVETRNKNVSPEGLEIDESYGLKEKADSDWPDGQYKVFPAEVQGDDQASILCAFVNPVTKDPGYARYDFKKVGGKWFQTGAKPVEAATVDKAKYAWEKKSEPDWADAGPKDLMPAKAAEVPKPAFSLTDEQFAREHLADPEKFNKKYGNQWVEVEGTITIPANEESPIPHVMILKGLEEIKTQPVACDISRPSRKAAAELVREQRVKLLGRRPEGQFGPNLVDCRIVSSSPAPPAKTADTSPVAPPTVGKKPADEPALRTWTSSNGKFTLQAQCVGVTDGKVQLKISDGKTVTLPLEKLSQADQDYLKENRGSR